MGSLHKALDLIRLAEITGDQTLLIDRALSESHCEDIPTEHVISVIRYIDLELAHNYVEKEIRQKLERLYNDLQDRLGHRAPR